MLGWAVVVGMGRWVDGEEACGARIYTYIHHDGVAGSSLRLEQAIATGHSYSYFNTCIDAGLGSDIEAAPVNK
jgi:hypothetical protein